MGGSRRREISLVVTSADYADSTERKLGHKKAQEAQNEIKQIFGSNRFRINNFLLSLLCLFVATAFSKSVKSA